MGRDTESHGVPPMSTMLEFATDYARRGWRVFPLNGKHPLFPKCPVNREAEQRGERGTCRGECGGVGHGCYDGTTDEARIREWWGANPGAGIGIACGPESDLWVLDVDPKNGGFESFQALEQRYPGRPSTLVVRTGGGGVHFYWRWPVGDGIVVRNRAGSLTMPDGRSLPGLDTRAAGGYVVAPPSRHPDGGTYDWAAGGDNVEPAPAWLVDIVRKREKAASPGVVVPFRYQGSDRDGHPYAVRALDNACARVAAAREGTRNDTLTREAYTIGGFVGAGELDRNAAIAALGAAGAAAGLEAGEARSLAQRQVLAGTECPTPVPERDWQPPRKPELVPPPEPDGDPGWSDGPPEIADGFDGYAEDADEPEPLGDRDDWADAIPLALTDMGNSRRLVQAFGANIRFSPQFGDRDKGWLRWDGRLWGRDESGQVMRYARCVSSMLEQEADKVQEDATEPEPGSKDPPDPRWVRAEAIRKWARRSQSEQALRAMVNLVRSETGIYVHKRRLDADPYLLGAPNGVVDLRTGKLLPHDRKYLLTKSAGAAYEPDMPCPLWEEFLARIMKGRQDMIDFLRRAAGYSLIAGTPEQVFIILYGSGHNGKGTFTSVLAQLFGDYAATIATEAFIGRKPGGIPNDIARLDGIRFASASEGAENAPLDEALVKTFTGSGKEKVTARFLNAEWFDFIPVTTVWYNCNHKPVIRGTDPGIWRRIRLVPFTYSFDGSPDKMQDYAGYMLEREAPGILSWIVRGALEWQRSGLTTPEGVLEATQEYRSEMDLIADFLDERCKITALQTDGASNADLFKAFSAWLKDNDERPKPQRWFTRQLKERGFEQTRTSAERRWSTIELLQAPVDERGRDRWRGSGGGWG